MSVDMSGYNAQVNFCFLNESNKIEGIHAIDYRYPRYQIEGVGHFGAFVLSQEMAKKHEPLTVRVIKQWQKLITIEQIPCGVPIAKDEIGHIRGPNLQKNVRIGTHIPSDYSEVPTLIETLMEDIKDDLRNIDKYTDDGEFSKLLGTRFLKFERIHPFTDGNGRVGRLLANYIATYCGRPIIVFNSELISRNRYIDAHASEEAMVAFMAQKIKQSASPKRENGVVDETDPSEESRKKPKIN